MPAISAELNERAKIPYPLEDSDGKGSLRPGEGCDSHGRSPGPAFGTKQTDDILIHPEKDFISAESGWWPSRSNEMYRILKRLNVTNVLVMGVHLNMCIMGRPVGIKTLQSWEMDTILVRDLTDAMYNPHERPYVSHEEATKLHIGFVEKIWAPSTTSLELIRGLYASIPPSLLPAVASDATASNTQDCQCPDCEKCPKYEESVTPEVICPTCQTCPKCLTASPTKAECDCSTHTAHGGSELLAPTVIAAAPPKRARAAAAEEKSSDAPDVLNSIDGATVPCVPAEVSDNHVHATESMGHLRLFTRYNASSIQPLLEPFNRFNANSIQPLLGSVLAGIAIGSAVTYLLLNRRRMKMRSRQGMWGGSPSR